MQKVLTSRNSELFRGCNDLHIASNGDIYFTDQGQTGLHDPTGRVYRLKTDGRLDCLIDTGISPNGLVLDPAEAVLFVAMTRDNAVWRMPFMKDGSVSKVGRFCSTVRPERSRRHDHGQGRPAVRRACLARPCLRVRAEWRMIARIKSCAGQSCTNVAIGGKTRSPLHHGVGDGHACWSRISAWRHCEERKRRSNPACFGALDCFASARNDGKEAS